jgi:hypothetical protein
MLNANRMLTRSTKLAAALAVTLATIAPAASTAHPAPPHAELGHHRSDPLPAHVREQLRQARRATRAFRELDAAKAAGYARASDCEADPKYGAMGIHYTNPALVADGKLDIDRPEVLVYQPTRTGKLRLGAIEYFQPDADQDLATDPDRPGLFDVPFDGPMLGHNPQMPIHYDLHVWLYRHNPAGLFAMWNPDVECPAYPRSAG